MSTLLSLPLLALGFVVLVGTITAVTGLHLRRGPRVSVDNARIETQSWLRIPYLDALFEFPQIARDVSGGWYLDRLDHPVRRVADVSSGNCPAWDCFWRSSPAYMEQAMERGQLARSMAGLVFSNHRPHDRCRDGDDSFRFDHAIALQLVPPRLYKHTHGVGS